jgi:hypothetical protein
MFMQLQDVVTPPTRRTGEPVRRHSRLKGREGVFWRPMSREDARRIVFAARRFDRSTKKRGKRNGELGHVALEIIDFLANLMNRKTGQLDPSIAYMMQVLGRSRDAIVRGLQALRQHGFLDWLRRYEPTGEASGPQVVQTSNAYRLVMPAGLGRIMGLYFTKAPTPADEAQRIEQLAQMLADYKRQLSLDGFVLFHFDAKDPLGEALRRFAASFTKRESAKQEESQSS